MARSIEHAHVVLSDLGKRLEVEIAKNCINLDKSNQEIEKRFKLSEQYSHCTYPEIQDVVKHEGKNAADIRGTLGDTIK